MEALPIDPPLLPGIAPTEIIRISQYRPARPATVPTTIQVALQVSHRLGVVALLALLGTVALMAIGKPFYWPLAITAGAADLGFCVALLTLSFIRRGRPVWREGVGVLAFNAVLATLALPLMLVARLDVIRTDLQDRGAAAKAQVQDFFTPPPALPPSE